MSESKSELLWWVNSLLELNYTHIEQLGTGAAYCQILDSIHGKLPISRVKFKVKMEYEAVQNYKILQSAFNTFRIDKHIPVDQLIKCRYNDNLQFLQWLKKYWDVYYSGKPYKAAEIRQRKPKAVLAYEKSRPTSASKIPSSITRKPVKSASFATHVSEDIPNSVDVSMEDPVETSTTDSVQLPALPVFSITTDTDKPKDPLLESDHASPSLLTTYRGMEVLGKELKEARAKNEEMEYRMNEMGQELNNVRNERNFYFNKLTDIEALLKDKKNFINPAMLIAQINQVLYNSEEGFEVPSAPITTVLPGQGPSGSAMHSRPSIAVERTDWTEDPIGM